MNDLAAGETAAVTCGLVMPISEIDGCTAGHWSEVNSILSSAIEDAGFQPRLVSTSDAVGIIQGRIIQNLYADEIVVCDVSAKNPNVMFELGIRLAFDKPVVVVKDDKTSYSFDTSPIEHITYPRDLRFNRIVEFQDELAEKVRATHKKSQNDPEYTTFLKHFGTFTIASLEKKEVTATELLRQEIQKVASSVDFLANRVMRSTLGDGVSSARPVRTLCLRSSSPEDAAALSQRIAVEFPELNPGEIENLEGGHCHITMKVMPDAATRAKVLQMAVSVDPKARFLPDGPGPMLRRPRTNAVSA